MIFLRHRCFCSIFALKNKSLIKLLFFNEEEHIWSDEKEHILSDGLPSTINQHFRNIKKSLESILKT